MRSLYDEYAVIASQIEELESKKDQLRGLILKQMIDNGEEKVETAVGKFTVAKRKTWTYTAKVIELADKLKATKAKEESTGDATYTEEESLRFTQIKL